VPSPAVREASREVVRAEGVVCRKSRGLLVHRASCPCLFPCAGRRNLLPAVPLSKLPRIIPSCSSSSSESLRSLLPLSPFRARALLPGSLPSSRHHRGASTHLEGFQVLDTFRPQVLSTSRRLSPHSGSRACFIPQPRPGRSARSGASHLRAAIVPLRYDLPPCRCVRQPLARTNPDGHRWRPRLRGLHPRRSSRTKRLAVSLPRGRTPLRVLSPPGPDFLPWSRFIRDLRS